MIKTATQAPKTVEWGIVTSPAGKLMIGVTDKGDICRISYMRQNTPADILAVWQGEWTHTHFKRGAGVVDFMRQPLLLVGTAFQHKVWREMAKIPAGKVLSYGDIAKRIGSPRAARGVGAACGANPVPYLVPCHRIIASGGKIGGFSSGLDIKKKLLKAEGVSF